MDVSSHFLENQPSIPDNHLYERSSNEDSFENISLENVHMPQHNDSCK